MRRQLPPTRSLFSISKLAVVRLRAITTADFVTKIRDLRKRDAVGLGDVRSTLSHVVKRPCCWECHGHEKWCSRCDQTSLPSFRFAVNCNYLVSWFLCLDVCLFGCLSIYRCLFACLADYLGRCCFHFCNNYLPNLSFLFSTFASFLRARLFLLIDFTVCRYVLVSLFYSVFLSVSLYLVFLCLSVWPVCLLLCLSVSVHVLVSACLISIN